MSSLSDRQVWQQRRRQACWEWSSLMCGVTAMCWRWADQRCHSSYKHELIWLRRHNKFPLRLRLRLANTSAESFWLRLMLRASTKTTAAEIPALCCLSVVALMSLCSLQIRGSALPGCSLWIRDTLVNDLNECDPLLALFGLVGLKHSQQISNKINHSSLWLIVLIRVQRGNRCTTWWHVDIYLTLAC